MLHALAIAAIVSAGPGWLGLTLALRDCARRDAEQGSPERDTARADEMRLAA